MVTPIMAQRLVIAALVSFLSNLTVADRMCDLFHSPACSSPFVPGHKNMGDAWFAISDKSTKISKIVTLLQVPVPPDDLKGVIAINTAVENTDIDNPNAPASETFQAITAAYPEGYAACGQNTTQWCSFQSEYRGYMTPKQATGKPYVKDAGFVALQWRYYRDQKHIMHAADNEAFLMPANDAPVQFWPKTECQCEASGTIGAHRYLNTYIRLEEASPHWGWFISQQNASHTTPYTHDGGKTWMIDRIDINKSYCDNTEKCPTELTSEDDSKSDWGLYVPDEWKEDFVAEAWNKEFTPKRDVVGEYMAWYFKNQTGDAGDAPGAAPRPWSPGDDGGS